jgi:hypothetical protein
MSECEGGTAVAIQVIQRVVAPFPGCGYSGRCRFHTVRELAGAIAPNQSIAHPTLPFVSSSDGLAVRRAICERGVSLALRIS